MGSTISGEEEEEVAEGKKLRDSPTMLLYKKVSKQLFVPLIIEVPFSSLNRFLYGEFEAPAEEEGEGGEPTTANVQYTRYGFPLLSPSTLLFGTWTAAAAAAERLSSSKLQLDRGGRRRPLLKRPTTNLPLPPSHPQSDSK